MLQLYTLWQLERELLPDDFQHILTPDAALEKATYSYDLDYRNYTSPQFGEVPRQLVNQDNNPYIRADRSVYDPVYDDLEINLLEGWIIGLDTDEHWDETVNPFHINSDGELVFDNADPFCWVISEFQRAYQSAINNQNGRKPSPTEQFRPSGEPLQHAQAAKTINSKAAGRLLAAGGIYNGNIEGFHETAQQLGGDAPAGYNQVIENKGLIIAGISVAAGAVLGRPGTVEGLGKLAKTEQLRTTLSANGKSFIINGLSQSGSRIDPAVKSGNFTVAGRALQKHGSREGSAFPMAIGAPSHMNKQGQQILDSIIRPPNAIVKEGNRFGGFDIIAPDGKGSRFDSDGNFRGFLEP